MELHTQIPTRAVGGRAPLDAFPTAVHSGRQYQPEWEQCTAQQRGHLVSRSCRAAYLDRVRSSHATLAYAKAMRKRRVWREPLVAAAKQWHGLAPVRLRGVPNATM